MYQQKTHCVAKRMTVVFILLLVAVLGRLNYSITNYVQFHSSKLENNKLVNGSDSDFLFLEIG